MGFIQVFCESQTENGTGELSILKIVKRIFAIEILQDYLQEQTEWLKTFPELVKCFQPFYFFAKKQERPLTFFHRPGMVTFTHQKKTQKHLKAVREKKVWR